MTATPPPLDDFAQEWLDRGELDHLHSLRNQWGQAHVNEDLTSLSWLAIPPLSGGYHTGVLRVDGRVLGAQQLRWAPWGVQRRAVDRGIRVLADVRMAYEASRVLWSITVTNETTERRELTLDQELLAPIAHSEVDWGWLYGTPWNAGHHHDYYATERLRSSVLEDDPGEVQLLPHGARFIRLGSPRHPGIQRDETSVPMLLESELPDHTTPDAGRVRPPAALATISDIRTSVGTVIAGPFVLDRADAEFRTEAVRLSEGGFIAFRADLAAPHQTGVLLTHGNHPDSIQVGLSDGCPWLAVGGERVQAEGPLGSGIHSFEVRVDRTAGVLLIDGTEAARTAPWRGAQRWRASVEGQSVLVRDSVTAARSAFAFASAPQRLGAEGARGEARWVLDLAPGESATVGFVLEMGTDRDDVLAGAAENALEFDSRLADVAQRWRLLWRNSFVPGNADHSGYLPVLEAEAPGLARTYYAGVLLALYLRNTAVSEIGPVFLTGGPRLGPTVTYYWDVSEWSRVAAMLEPVAHRAWLVAALSVDYEASHSFDTRSLLPVGNHYASNDHALFRLVKGYVGVTGDTSILDEAAGDRTVLDHLRSLAYRPRSQRAAFGDGTLVDFGSDAWELLECVPNYRDAVVSFNAGYVGMLRSLAGLLRQRGELDEARRAETDADQLAQAVLGQYAGGGRWRISHPYGIEVIGHCLDFELVAAEMAGDLSASIRSEMIEFVTTHLIDGNWMRALSPDDPIAPWSDRPDHGAAGAFAAWPGSTAYGLARLGRADLAADFLSRVHLSRSGALWGQAVEAVGGGRYRVTERGVSNRDSNAAIAVVETVIAGLFGIDADFESLQYPSGSLTTEFGRLSGVRAIGFDLARESPDP